MPKEAREDVSLDEVSFLAVQHHWQLNIRHLTTNSATAGLTTDKSNEHDIPSYACLCRTESWLCRRYVYFSTCTIVFMVRYLSQSRSPEAKMRSKVRELYKV